MVLKLNEEWRIQRPDAMDWDEAARRFDTINAELRVMQETSPQLFDFSHIEETQEDEIARYESDIWYPRATKYDNYVIVSNEDTLLGFIVVDRLTGDIVKKSMLAAEDIAKIYEDEADEIIKRRKNTQKIIAKYL